MIIVGCKGFAKELLEVCHQLGRTENLAFFDNISTHLPEQLFGQFPILRSEDEVKAHFKENSKDFALGLGNPKLRMRMCELFENWGGILKSIISPHAAIANFGLEIGPGATILAHATITGSAQIGKGLLMYPNALITHDCVISNFVELSPGATILGNCQLAENVQIGSNATILPNLYIGQNVIVGAGAVVTKNIDNNKLVKGVPAK